MKMTTVMMGSVLGFLMSTLALAIDLPAPASSPVPAAPTMNNNIQRAPANVQTLQNGQGPGGKPSLRKKELNFEGRGVEVLLGKDYDSLSQTGTVEPANREKLYKTRLFMNESENLLQELEYSR